MIIKAANARNVIPFPVRYAEPLLIDRAMESNRRQLELSRLRRRRAVVWACAFIVAAVAGVAIGWVVGR